MAAAGPEKHPFFDHLVPSNQAIDVCDQASGPKKKGGEDILAAPRFSLSAGNLDYSSPPLQKLRS
jgi:hypothetical protein